MPALDKFDRISTGALVILVIGSLSLVHDHKGEAKPDSRQRASAAVQQPAGADLGNAVKLARNLLEAGNLARAEGLAWDLTRQYPYEGEPRMLIGDILMRRQDPVKAMHEYKEAIDLNPDYLDKKTPLFQGKKLKIAVGEALAEIDRQLKLSPGDESLKGEKRVIYYLYRRIAGSCG